MRRRDCRMRGCSRLRCCWRSLAARNRRLAQGQGALRGRQARKARSSSGERIAARSSWIPAAFGKFFPGIDGAVPRRQRYRGQGDRRGARRPPPGRRLQNSLTGTLPVAAARPARDRSIGRRSASIGRNIAFDGKMAYTSNIVYTIAYNTKLVEGSRCSKELDRQPRRALSAARAHRARSCCRG